MIRVLLVLALILLASGCTVAPATSFDAHLGTTTYTSSMVRKSVSRVSEVAFVAMAVSNGQDELWGLRTYVIRSDLNYPKIDSARSFGADIPYKRLDRHRIGSLRAEMGVVPLSEALVMRFARTGFAFQLSGPRGSYEFRVAGRVFEELLRERDPGCCG